MRHIRNKLTVILLMLVTTTYGQDELMDLLNDGEVEDKVVTATFKSTRLINGHNIETRPAGVLEFVISHRFGVITNGFYDLFGLDYSSIRFGLEYGVTDKLNIGAGRASFNKTFDGFAKYKLLQQSTTMPVSMTGFVNMTVRTDDFYPDLIGETFKSAHRMAYTYQLLLARKFNSDLSLQLMPTMIHRNYVFTLEEPNNLFAVGYGGRYKVTNRVTINFEHYPLLNMEAPGFSSVIAFGVDIETGGHVFQLHLTNAQQMNEPGFVGMTTELPKELHFGFNISRVFQLKN
ncbi:MAG: hypothetical protein JXQ90_06605 [Cyclobacteriaceae bacterium]